MALTYTCRICARSYTVDLKMADGGITITGRTC